MQLSLQEFRESRVFHKEGDDNSGLEGPGWVYASGSCYINVDPSDGAPYLIIYNQGWQDRTLEELEKILYYEFYVAEMRS